MLFFLSCIKELKEACKVCIACLFTHTLEGSLLQSKFLCNSSLQKVPQYKGGELSREVREWTTLRLQSDSGGICNTLGNDSMCDSKQKSSYEHGSDFERLPRYGKKKIRTILRARTAIT